MKLQENANSTQHRILNQLLFNKSGLSIDEMANTLQVTRTAIQQQFVALERDGLIKKKQTNRTAGRPVNIYELTDSGINSFPKQYAWFSEIVLNDLLEELGETRFLEFMQRLGRKMAGQLKAKISGKHFDSNLRELVNLMSELGFQAQSGIKTETGEHTITAVNCIHHDLAKKHQAVCSFDISLMSNLLEKNIKHTQCMAKGDCLCEFVIQDQFVKPIVNFDKLRQID